MGGGYRRSYRQWVMNASRTGRGASSYLAASIPVRLASSGITVALPVLAVQQLGSIAPGGLLVAASLAPSIIVAPLAGAALDRARRPRRLILASALVTAAAFAVTALIGVVPVVLAAVALIAAGCFTPFFMGGLSSVVGEIVEDERRAYALDALSYNVAGVGGPALASLLIAVADARVAMIALAVAAAISAVAAFAVHLTARSRSEHPAGLAGEIGRGLAYLVRHRPLAVITWSGTLTQLGQGALPVAAIALALQSGADPGEGTWIVTAFSIGALVGSIAATATSSTRFAPISVMLGGFLATGVFTLVLALHPGTVLTLAAAAAAGFASAPATAAMLLLRKQQSAAAVRSQVFTVGAGLRATAGAVGAAIAGLSAGISAALLIALVGAAWVVSAGILILYPRQAPPILD